MQCGARTSQQQASGALTLDQYLTPAPTLPPVGDPVAPGGESAHLLGQLIYQVRRRRDQLLDAVVVVKTKLRMVAVHSQADAPSAVPQSKEQDHPKERCGRSTPREPGTVTGEIERPHRLLLPTGSLLYLSPRS